MTNWGRRGTRGGATLPSAEYFCRERYFHECTPAEAEVSVRRKRFVGGQMWTNGIIVAMVLIEIDDDARSREAGRI